MKNIVKPSYNKINGTGIGASIDGTRIIDDDGWGVAKSKINNVVKEKQRKNADSEIYYLSKQEQNFNNTR